MFKKTAEIRFVCLKQQEDAAAHKEKLLACQEEIATSVNAVLEHSNTTVDALQQQQNDVSNSAKKMSVTFRESTLPLLHETQVIASSVRVKQFF